MSNERIRLLTWYLLAIVVTGCEKENSAQKAPDSIPDVKKSIPHVKKHSSLPIAPTPSAILEEAPSISFMSDHLSLDGVFAEHNAKHRMHAMVNIKDAGPIAGPAAWMNITGSWDDFTNPIKLLTGQTLDTETFSFNNRFSPPTSSSLEEYKVILGADPLIRMPGIPGELRVWIGNPNFDPKFPENMTKATSTLPAIGETAKVTPFAPAFTIEPGKSECMKIDPTGSTVRFKLIPSKPGFFYVGADVQLFSSDDCGGTPIPKSTETLQVQVAVAHDEVTQERTQKLWEIVWQKFLDFFGQIISGFFILLLYLIRGRLKKWFFENDR